MNKYAHTHPQIYLRKHDRVVGPKRKSNKNKVPANLFVRNMSSANFSRLLGQIMTPKILPRAAWQRVVMSSEFIICHMRRKKVSQKGWGRMKVNYNEEKIKNLEGAKH